MVNERSDSPISVISLISTDKGTDKIKKTIKIKLNDVRSLSFSQTIYWEFRVEIITKAKIESKNPISFFSPAFSKFSNKENIDNASAINTQPKIIDRSCERFDV
jgi:hypothetical protein